MMEKDRKMPENILIALTFFAGLFGFVGILLVGGYCYLADKRESTKQSSLLSLGIAIAFAVILLLISFINLFVSIPYAVNSWISVIENILYAVLGFLAFFNVFPKRRGAQPQEVPSEMQPSAPAAEPSPSEAQPQNEDDTLR